MHRHLRYFLTCYWDRGTVLGQLDLSSLVLRSRVQNAAFGQDLAKNSVLNGYPTS